MNYSKLVYRMRFQNVEETIVNADIWDMAEAFGDNPYNIAINVVDNGDGTQAVTFTFDAIPGIITAISLDYSDDNGVNWTTTAAGGLTSPQSITIPTGSYLYRFVVTRPTFSSTTQFNGDNRLIITEPTNFFYPGQRVSISGTTSNNIEVTVISTTLFLVQFTLSDTDLVTEADAEATFTDITSSESFIIGEDVEEVTLTPGGDPLHILTTDNDENKFTNVIGKTAELVFLSENGVGFNNFADGEDNRFFVNIYINDDEDLTIFKGYLVLEDNSELFMPESNEVLLTATDNLGLLSDVPLTDFDGDTPQDAHEIMSYLAWCLSKTNLQLPIFVAMNIRHVDAVALSADDSGSGHFFKDIFLDAKTFEEDIGTCHNCYDVLDKILRYECRLIQRSGAWWIVRVDEYEERDGLYVFEFDWEGNFVANHGLVSLAKEIYKGDSDGSNEGQIFFSGEETNVQADQARKFVRLTYPIEYPLELVCNIDFSRGQFSHELPDEENENGAIEQVSAFDIECWDFLSKEGGQPNTWEYYGQSPIANTDAYIKKNFYAGQEVEREIVIEGPPGSGSGVPYIQAQDVDVYVRDKVYFAVTVSYSNIGSSTGYVNSPVMILLEGNSGALYWWKAYSELDPNAPQQWVEVPIGNVIEHWYLGADIEGDPVTMSFESPPLPESGKLKIILINQYGSEIKAHFTGLDVRLIEFINGAYSRYDARVSKVEQMLNYKQVLDEEVNISDSPRKYFKGALLDGDDANLLPITPEFYNAAVYPDEVPASGSDAIHPYYHIQNFDVWNQFNRAFRIFQAQAQGITSDDTDDLGYNNAIDGIHKWTLADPNASTNNRYFLLLTFDIDWYLCEWVGTMKEVFKTDTDKDYASQHEVKFITNDTSNRG